MIVEPRLYRVYKILKVFHKFGVGKQSRRSKFCICEFEYRSDYSRRRKLYFFRPSIANYYEKLKKTIDNFIRIT